MSKRDMGGPAFPRPASIDAHDIPCNVYQDQQGMTLWDFYAAAALGASTEKHSYSDFERSATYAANVADAMLEQRRKRESEL